MNAVTGAISSRLPRSDGAFLAQVMILTWLVRLLLVTLIDLTDAIRALGLSSDSFLYHHTALQVAAWLKSGGALGDLQWVDEGWFQFTGVVYYLLGPNPVWVQLINITLGTLAVYFSYVFALRAFGDRNVARLSALFVAFFPSFVYWSTLMLKDPAGLLAMAMIVCALVSLRERVQIRWLLALGLGLLIYLGIRQYMFLVCLLVIPVAIIPFARRRPGSALLSVFIAVVLVNAITLPLGYGFLGLSEIGQSHYFDLGYINQTRINIGDHGRGAIFDAPSEALWGSDWGDNLRHALITVFYFFVSIDLSNIRSHRQLMALPEVLLFLSILPSLIRGTWRTWTHYRHTAWPVLLMALVVLAVYGSATTNLGALFRWRMQSLPMFMAMAALGIVLYQKSWVWRLGFKMGLFR